MSMTLSELGHEERRDNECEKFGPSRSVGAVAYTMQDTMLAPNSTLTLKLAVCENGSSWDLILLSRSPHPFRIGIRGLCMETKAVPVLKEMCLSIPSLNINRAQGFLYMNSHAP